MRKQIFEKTDIAKTVKGVLEKISVVTFYENKGIDFMATDVNIGRR